MTIAQSEIHELEQFRATLIELKSQTDKEVVLFDGVEVNIKDKLNEIALKSEDEFENSPKTIVAGVVAFIMGLKSKTEMKQVSEASGVSALSIYKLVGKI